MRLFKLYESEDEPFDLMEEIVAMVVVAEDEGAARHLAAAKHRAECQNSKELCDTECAGHHTEHYLDLDIIVCDEIPLDKSEIVLTRTVDVDGRA